MGSSAFPFSLTSFVFFSLVGFFLLFFCPPLSIPHSSANEEVEKKGLLKGFSFFFLFFYFFKQ